MLPSDHGMPIRPAQGPRASGRSKCACDEAMMTRRLWHVELVLPCENSVGRPMVTTDLSMRNSVMSLYMHQTSPRIGQTEYAVVVSSHMW